MNFQFAKENGMKGLKVKFCLLLLICTTWHLLQAPLSPHLEYKGFQTLLRLQSSKVLLFSFYNKIRISGFYDYVINTLKEDHPVRSGGSTAWQGALYSSGLFPHGNHLLILYPSLRWSRDRMTEPRPPLYSFACCSQL